MKVLPTILSLSLTAIGILPAAALDVSTSDRATWIEQTLSKESSFANSYTGSSKKPFIANTSKATSSKSATNVSSLTSSSSGNLSRSVANLFPGVKMRPFVPNRYLPSEHDIELAEAQAQAATLTQSATNVNNAANLPATTVQLARAMAPNQLIPQAINVQQRQMQGYVAHSVPSRMPSTQRQMNALAPSIPEPPMSDNITVAQIRSSLRNNQLIAAASGPNNSYSANLYPDIVRAVPTQATTSNKGTPSPLSFLSRHSTRQLSGASTGGAYTSSANTSYTGNSYASNNYASNSSASTRTMSGKYSNLSFGGFKSYVGKVSVKGPSVQSYAPSKTMPQAQKLAPSNARTTYTSSLQPSYNIASADCYSTETTPRAANYSSYVDSSQSSALPY